MYSKNIPMNTTSEYFLIFVHKYPTMCQQNWALKNINNKMFANFQSTTIESATKLHIGQEDLSMLYGVYLSGRYTGNIFQS